MKQTITSLRVRITVLAFCVSSLTCIVEAQDMRSRTGIMVDLGGHRLHVNCTGQGQPTVVVENGLGDFSFDWILVQTRVSKFTRICTYDRAGYAWSDPGPMPRTYAQLNLELHDALAKLGEHGPFILVGHSFGGPVIRNYALTYPREVAGLVFVDAAGEDSRYTFRGKAILMRSGAKGATIPLPRENMLDSDKTSMNHQTSQQSTQPLDSLYDPLPPIEKRLQLWAQSLPGIDVAENSQREWSPEYLQKWHDAPQAGILGAIPVIVLTRAHGGYGNDLDIPAAQLERERLESQIKLTLLSTNSKQVIVNSGHNMELEAPDAVTAAIRQATEAVRSNRKLEAQPNELRGDSWNGQSIDSQYLAKRASQVLAKIAAQRQFGAVCERDDVIAMKHRFQFANTVHIDHRGPMNTHELSGIEPTLELLQSVANQM